MGTYLYHMIAGYIAVGRIHFKQFEKYFLLSLTLYKLQNIIHQNQINMTEQKPKTGRKPIEDKKVPVTIYRPKSEINALGGLVSARTIINEFITQKLTK